MVYVGVSHDDPPGCVPPPPCGPIDCGSGHDILVVPEGVDVLVDAWIVCGWLVPAVVFFGNLVVALVVSPLAVLFWVRWFFSFVVFLVGSSCVFFVG